jgi:hypothetical protein
VIPLNRGYAGFYRGHYLRSSYEYAYARYLDYNSIPWSYEDETYDIGYKLYKPDFFFYNQNGSLYKIVEIKSRNTTAISEAKRALSIIKKSYNIDCQLLSYVELLELYQQLPFSLNSIITQWIGSKETTINKAAFGALNGHYNLKHSADTKKKIGEHTKRLWASDCVARQRMIEGLKKSGMKKGYIKTPREIKTCEECSEKFEVLITSSKRYCSQSCAGKVAIKRATDRYVEKRINIHKSIKEYIIKWSLAHIEIVTKTPLNRIKSALSPLLKDIHEQFGVKDFRVISKAVFGEDRGRKELIKFMKKVCDEKIC